MQISGALVEAVVNLLRGIGILQHPDQEVELRQSLSDLEASKARVWVDFVRATSPDPDRVYVWANSVIALVRPAISVLIVLGMLFAPARILDLIRTFGEAGPSGWVVLFPLLWWFLGRDVNKVLALRYGGLIPVGSGATLPPDQDPRRESQERWERIERLMEELNGSTGAKAGSEVDRPGDR